MACELASGAASMASLSTCSISLTLVRSPAPCHQYLHPFELYDAFDCALAASSAA